MKTDFRVPVPEEVRSQMNEVGNIIGDALPQGYGFALLIFEYREGGALSWISSAERESMLAALQEFIRAQGS